MTQSSNSVAYGLITVLVILQSMAVYFIGDSAIAVCVLPEILWLVLLWTFFNKTEHTIIVSAFGILLTLWFIWLAVVGLWSHMAQDHYDTFNYMIFWLLVYWLFMLRPELNRHWKLLFFAFSIVVLISIIVAGYQHLILNIPPSGFFRDKNTLSTITNLFAFPMLAYLWILLINKSAPILPRLLLAGITFILFLSATITGSRGATLAAIFGLIVFVFIIRKQITLKSGVWLVVVALFPILYSICFGLDAHTTHSLASLSHPLAAGENRFVLWQPAWILIKEHFWFGIGLGNFAWYLPALRSVLDTSRGIYVHNDYLQIWLEAGVVGFVLLLGVLISLGYIVVKFFRVHKFLDAKKIEVLGLALGIGTVLFYSLFTFTLYLTAIMFPLALYCGRLHYLIKDDLSLKTWVFNATNYTRKSMFYLLGIVIALVLSIYYFATAATLWLDNKGDRYFMVNDLANAARYYQYASWLQPNRMELIISEQQLYLKQDELLQPKQQLEKFMLYQQLQPSFDLLTKKYPLYAYNYFLQAEYYTRNPNMVGKQSYCVTKNLYQKTLQLWPSFSLAQQGYAGFIQKFGDKPC